MSPSTVPSAVPLITYPAVLLTQAHKTHKTKQVMSLNLIIEQKMSSEEKISNCINENYEEIKKIIDENIKQNEEEKKK